MPQATGSRLALAYVAEVTAGTTPTTPALLSVPIISTDLQLSRGLVSDSSLRPDRMKRYSRLGNKSVGGKVQVAYAPDVYDDWLAAVMFSAGATGWTTNVAKVGTTQKSFSIEHGQADIGQYRQFTGCTPSAFTLNVPSGNTLVTADFEFVGMNGAIAATSLDADGYGVPAVTGDPFVHLDGSFTEGGSSIAYMTGLQLKIDNKLQSNYALGSSAARSITPGMASVTGQITVFFESAALITKFLAETNSSLTFTLVSGAKSQIWNMPVVQYNAANVAVSGDGPQVITLPFEALYDSGIGSVLQVTRA